MKTNLINQRKFVKIYCFLFLFLSLILILSSYVYSYNQFYSIHIGSFKNMNNAIKEVCRLKQFGFSAIYRFENVQDKGQWYRVYIGRFNSIETANKIGKHLKENNIISNFLVKSADINFVSYNDILSSVEFAESAILFSNPIPKENEIVKSFTDKNIPQLSDMAQEKNIDKELQVNENFYFYGDLQKLSSENVDVTLLSLGPKYIFDVSEKVVPYFKGGLLYGNSDNHTEYKNSENSMGWESGVGLNFMNSNFEFGFDIIYRDIKFERFPNNNHLDISDCTVFASLSHYF